MPTQTARLGPREIELLERLQRSGRAVVRMDRDRSLFSGFEANALRLVLRRLSEGRWLHRLERGAYVVTGPGRLAVRSQLAIAADWLEGEPYVIGGFFALAHWNLTTDAPTTVEVFLARRKPSVRYRHTLFRFIYVPREKLVPAREVSVPGARAPARIAGPEHTLAQILAGRHATSISVAEEALRSGLRQRVLNRYRLLRIFRSAPAVAARRLGWLAERNGERFASELRAMRGSDGYLPLDPGRKVRRGRRNATWRLVENVELPG